MPDIDILDIDEKIRKKFEEEHNRLPEYQEKLETLEKSLCTEDLKRSVRTSLERAKVKLKEYVENLENNIDLNFYLIDTIPLIDRYKIMLKTPVKLDYLGRPVKNSKEKRDLVDKFISVASKYIDIDIETNREPEPITCQHCGKKDFEISNSTAYTCTNCSAQQIVVKNISSYSDIDRVNISTKYMYDRKIHFRDCIKQYQGKQNSTIKPHIYTDLILELDRHNLLIGTPDTPKEERFSKVTKKHILIFLKELEYTKQYENVHLIHYNLTNQPRNDISHLEDKLFDDFDVFIELYDKVYKGINRKNFINVQVLFYELLCRHKHPCKKEEIVVLKTTDRKLFHDDVTMTLFEMLGWNHTSLY
jgi:hypothetical protein